MNPEINNPGALTNVCVEIDVFNLAFNTVLQASYINDIEGGLADGFSGPQFLDDQFKSAHSDKVAEETEIQQQLKTSALATSDENHVNSRTFKLMREMVQSWHYQFESRNDRLAEMMLEHLYRWLTSSSSRMHDPAFFLMIHGFMRKVFLQLLAEFKQLGSTIVYASFEKIILNTPKSSLPNAINYGRYIVEALGKKPLFSYLNLTVDQYWDYLLFMDRHNYGGIVCDNPDLILSELRNNKNNNGIPLVADREKASISLRWNIMDYLPPAVQTFFKRIIGQYIYEAHKDKSEQRSKESLLKSNMNSTVEEDGDGEMSGMLNNNPENNPTISTAAVKIKASTSQTSALTKHINFLRLLISRNLKRYLFKIVPKMERRIHDDLPSQGEESYFFPDLPGSHLEFKNPALEFVKTICAVLELDKSVEREVRVLKRDLLNLIGVREFSEEAKFTNPCEPFRLPQIICEYCNLTRDLDLTRDPDLLPLSALDAASAADAAKADEKAHVDNQDDVSDKSDVDEDEDEDEEVDHEGLNGSDEDEEGDGALRSYSFNKSKRVKSRKPKRENSSHSNQINLKESNLLASIAFESGPREWLCTGCGTSYDRGTIEQQLVDIVSRRLLAWQLQDVKCSKCKMVKAENIRGHCECSGQYTTQLSRSEFVRRMKVFANIARFHRMEMLSEVVNWVISCAF